MYEPNTPSASVSLSVGKRNKDRGYIDIYDTRLGAQYKLSRTRLFSRRRTLVDTAKQELLLLQIGYDTVNPGNEIFKTVTDLGHALILASTEVFGNGYLAVLLETLPNKTDVVSEFKDMNAVVSCFDSGACLAQLGAAEKNIERIEEIRDRLQEYESWWLFLQRSPWTEVGKLGSSFNIEDGWSLLRGELGAIPDATIHVCKDFTESYWAFYTASYPSDDLLGRIHIHLRKAKEAGVGVACLGDISANEDRLEY